jgi:hypothetical protein
MRLYTIMSPERLLKVGLPTAPLPVIHDHLEADHEGAQAPRGAGTSAFVVKGFVRRLTQEQRGAVLWASELERTIGLRRCDLKRYLKKPAVKPVVDAYGWRVVTRKDLGLAGKGQGIRRAA